ncbi:VQ motif-containing protein 4-like [Mangifera indica]|uniref:VQ motif-containing protein 4-like n=1 Tax=Mangifera indica TaxID=29780 RepID=UPI001CFB8095|nr:VQ motif-containing protein 4-like [Mangifera indica]
METSPKHLVQDTTLSSSLLPSPNSSASSSTISSSPTTPKPVTRSDSANPYPTTFVQADTSTFKQVVQMLTGSSETAKLASKPASQPEPNSNKTHNIPLIKSTPKKQQQQSSFKLYERRNSLKNLRINPLNPNSFLSSGFSPRKPDILSPSILDFPSLVLSPVTPLIPDPFDRSGPVYHNNKSGLHADGSKMDQETEEQAIKEKGYYLHPSPSTTPRNEEPRLLPLFPVTSPRVSGSAASNS